MIEFLRFNDDYRVRNSKVCADKCVKSTVEVVVDMILFRDATILIQQTVCSNFSLALWWDCYVFVL